MELKLSMWNFHSWLKNRGIDHSFSIRSNEAAICGIRLKRESATDGCALLSEAPRPSGYQTVLAFGENHIYFRSLSVFQALDELNYMLSVYDHWRQALQKINLMYGEIKELLALSYELLPYPTIVTQGDQLLAVSPKFRSESETVWAHYSRLPLEEHFRRIPEGAAEDRLPEQTAPVLISSAFLQGQQMILCSSHFQQQQFRILSISNGTPLSPGDLHLLRILAEAVRCNLELWHRRLRKQSMAPESMFLSMLQSNALPEQCAAALRQLKWKMDQHYTVFWLEKRNGSDSLVLDKLYQSLKEHYPTAFCLQYRCAVLLFCNLDTDSEIPSGDSLRRLLPEERFVIGQSSIGAAFSPQLARQAEKAMLRARQKHSFFLSAQQVILDDMHQALLGDTMVQSLVHPAVRQLQRHDLTENSRFTEILWQYLRCGGNCNAAAKTLHIHRNTLLSHLERIQALTGVSLDEPREREALLLSLLVSRQPDSPGE